MHMKKVVNLKVKHQALGKLEKKINIKRMNMGDVQLLNLAQNNLHHHQKDNSNMNKKKTNIQTMVIPQWVLLSKKLKRSKWPSNNKMLMHMKMKK